MPMLLKDEGELKLIREIQKKYYWTGPSNKRVKVPFTQIVVHISVRGCNAVAIIALDGWTKSEWEKKSPWEHHQWARDTSGMQLRFSMNAPMHLTWNEWQQINSYIETLYYRLMDGATDIPEDLP